MEEFSKEKLTKDFEAFGGECEDDFSHFFYLAEDGLLPLTEIEHINFVPEKKIGFVNFCSIHQAVRALEGIKKKTEYAELKVAYGKDRCANAPGPK